MQAKSADGINDKIAVIIVSWNGLRFLSDCLSSISNQIYDNYRVILVDNGSEDASVDFIRNNFPNIEIIELDKNTGFAVANNTGIRKAFEDKEVRYIVPLNNDTKADNNFLRELARTYNEYARINGEKVGSVAPKILKFYEEEKVDSAGILIYKDGSAINRGMDEDDQEEYNNSVEVFGPSGCACLYLREALEDVAYQKLHTATSSNNDKEYFDKDYFCYYEDVDLAWRLRLRGWKCFYAPKAKVLHIHSATGVSSSPFKAFHIHRNQYYNLIKNFPASFLVKGLLFMLYRYCLLLMSTLKSRGPSARLKENSNMLELVKIVAKSWWQVLTTFPKLLQKRRFVQRNRRISIHEFEGLLKEFESDLDKMIFGN